MKSKKFDELKKKVAWAVKELAESKKENARLNRLLITAEENLKKKPGRKSGNSPDGSILNLTRQIEKFKGERKIIRTKVEKMASKLEQFYND
jgi:uncharacterized coiled-coil DUF342 family protein